MLWMRGAADCPICTPQPTVQPQFCTVSPSTELADVSPCRNKTTGPGTMWPPARQSMTVAAGPPVELTSSRLPPKESPVLFAQPAYTPGNATTASPSAAHPIAKRKLWNGVAADEPSALPSHPTGLTYHTASTQQRPSKAIHHPAAVS